MHTCLMGVVFLSLAWFGDVLGANPVVELNFTVVGTLEKGAGELRLQVEGVPPLIQPVNATVSLDFRTSILELVRQEIFVRELNLIFFSLDQGLFLKDAKKSRGRGNITVSSLTSDAKPAMLRYNSDTLTAAGTIQLQMHFPALDDFIDRSKIRPSKAQFFESLAANVQQASAQLVIKFKRPLTDALRGGSPSLEAELSLANLQLDSAEYKNKLSGSFSLTLKEQPISFTVLSSEEVSEENHWDRYAEFTPPTVRKMDFTAAGDLPISPRSRAPIPFRSLCVIPLVFENSGASANANLAKAQEFWRASGILLRVTPRRLISESDFAGLDAESSVTIDDFLHLDSRHNDDHSPTETQLLREYLRKILVRIREGIETQQGRGCIPVVFVKRSNIISNNRGAWTSVIGEAADSFIVLSDESTPSGQPLADTRLAHEIGHILSADHPGSGHASENKVFDATEGTIMCTANSWEQDHPEKNSVEDRERLTNSLLIVEPSPYRDAGRLCSGPSCGDCR